MHYNKEFSFGSFLTSEHQSVGIYLWSYFRPMPKDRIQTICDAGFCFSSHGCKLGTTPLGFISERL